MTKETLLYWLHIYLYFCMKDVHDITFKSLMESKPFFIAFFKQYLPSEVFNNIDWDSTRIFKISGEHIREVFPFDNAAQVRVTKDLADLAYLVDMKKEGETRKAMITLHVEHQVNPDKFLPLRLALYLLGMLYEYARINNTDSLPQTYSLIYYHGRQSPYPYHKNVPSMFDPDYDAEKHLLNPVFIDLGNIADETLLQHRETAGAELAFKHIFSKRLGQYVDLIGKNLRHADGNTRVNVLRYILNAGEDPSGAEVLKRLTQAIPEEEKLIMTIADQLRQEARTQALHEGMQQGMQQGEHEKALAIARNMLFRNIDISFIKEVTGLSDIELTKITQSH